MTNALWMSHTAETGGAELFLIDVVTRARKGWDACFLGPGDAVDVLSQAGREAHVVKGGEGLLGVRRDSSMLQALRGGLDMAGAAMGVAKLMRDYDVLFANSQKAFLVGAMACSLAGKPLVWVLHDIITDPSFSASNRKIAVGLANHRTRAVVVNSLATAESFAEAGGKPGLTELVYNGFDVDSFADVAPANLREELGLDGRPVLGLFGRLSPWKGQHVLLEALGADLDAQAVFVGGPLFGEEAYEQALHQRVAELGLEDRVRFLGFRKDVARLMRGVDVVVHASTHPEPFGRVLVEAFLCGKPVVATDAGGVGEIAEHERTALLAPLNDAAGLAAEINRLLADPELGRRLAEAGRAVARERFDIRTSLARLEEIAERVAAGRGPLA